MLEWVDNCLSLWHYLDTSYHPLQAVIYCRFKQDCKHTCQFPPTQWLFNNGHVTVFLVSMRFYLHSQCLVSTFRYLWSIQSLVVPTGRMVFLLMQICNILTSWGAWTLWIMRGSNLIFNEFAQQQMKSCSGFVFCEDLQHFLWVFHCFSAFWTIVTFLIYLKDRLVLQARPFLLPH